MAAAAAQRVVIHPSAPTRHGTNSPIHQFWLCPVLARGVQSCGDMSFADDMEERLRVFALATIRFCRTLPRTDEAREWGGQLRRASTGASANYRASRRGKSKPDWLDKIADAVEELDECDMWLSTIEASAFALPPQELQREARELRAILATSLTTGRATYWSRSREQYWVKGETSGHVQHVHEVRLDCDGDALLVVVDQTGPACHTGTHSCFDADVLLSGT